MPQPFTFLEFFAGCGLASEGLRPFFRPVWANDYSPKKAEVYEANHDSKVFHLGSIEHVSGSTLPDADMAWASFPCQDLSLAGKMDGILAARSGMVWEWLRVLEEMGSRQPKVIVAENVLGLVSAGGGSHYRQLHRALERLGYTCGALVLDAIRWVPQSRQRVFVVGVLGEHHSVRNLISPSPKWGHPATLVKAASGLKGFAWWMLPEPKIPPKTLDELIDFDAPVDSQSVAQAKLALVPAKHLSTLVHELANGFKVAPGYRRMRNGVQCLELRFDRVAGCLRTPAGGSSRQTLVLKKDGRLCTRLLTVREAARLMGAPESFRLPASYNDGYKAMGDAVVVPVVRHLAKHLLHPLCVASKGAHV